MSDRLPPLTALRAFDAAARHMSFAKAAEELSVTPAALSFQIKSLEEHLGAPLFRRLNRAVELTAAGKTLAAGTEQSFEGLRLAWRNVTRAQEENTLTVTAGPAFTAKWLAPRLFHFVQAHPEIELRFSATLRIMDFDRDDVDVAIRFGMGGRNDDGLYSKPIIQDWVTPMMHPVLAEKYPDPESLAHAPLLDQEDTRFLKPALDWPAWFRAAGLTASPEISAHFNQADHAIDAAAAGGGVILGRVSLSERDLLEGRLVMPFPLALTTEAHYRFVCPHGTETRPQVAAFLAWLEAEAQSLLAYREGREFISAADVSV
ncbi:MAG: transcriptional regulator GcvA [Roseicyclus sp.]|uniref:transcriptional regulator GcvA n=1 Tax=Boseongicola sp. H5 TaxID=2763261 RepID=UPI001B0BBA5E|nr:transcriptional regulator GcvA [Boseongicola sp. H5]MBO6602737.1 transcriptional regulator GcvA [Roseicyclus sp.]MBO6623968.1 transcriptional regulator GcvA [Roseicyclus sp.]MBO6923023.1 transcriptional regulator GcvA [Roseicyclus sp.]